MTDWPYVFLFLPCLFSYCGWCVGACIVPPICFDLLWLSLYVRCLVVLVFSVWFLVVSRVPVGLLFWCCLFLGCFGLLCFWCVGLLRLGSLSPCFVPLLPAPQLVLWCLWSSQCSVGPSLWVSGCICDGPVVMPVAWSVVTAWHLSPSLHAKASALCGALPSTHCCECSTGALPSCTEVFIFSDPNPLRTPLELHAPFSLACAASSLLSLLPSRAPSLSCCCWPPPAVFPSSLFVLWLSLPASLPLCVLVCGLLPLCFGLLLWLLVCFCLVFLV